jgi:hypothetical protein
MGAAVPGYIADRPGGRRQMLEECEQLLQDMYVADRQEGSESLFKGMLWTNEEDGDNFSNMLRADHKVGSGCS